MFGPGDLRGMPAVLDDEKRALIWSMYEVFPKGHKQAGRRRFKRVALSLAKGLAKTEFAAWIAACELHPEAPVRFGGFNRRGDLLEGQAVRDPYIPLVAYTEEQSEELAYGTLFTVISEGPMADDFDIGLARIMRKRGDGRAVALSAAPNARDGARTTFQVADETHWWTLPRLKQAHQTMMANLPKRMIADAWALEVTTAPEPGGGSVAEDTMEYARAVVEGRAKDSRLFFFHRQASDDHDLTSEEGARAAVLEASGDAASWRDIEGIVELWRDPTTDRTYWERVWTNRLVRSSDQAFDVKRWRELGAPQEVADGELITLGFDGSRYDDATALVATTINGGYQWPIGIWECPPGRLGTWEVPADEVDDAVHAAYARWNVWRLQADPHFWDETLAKWSGRYGKDRVVSFDTRGWRRMSDALRAYATALETGELSHGGDPVLTRHVGAAHRRYLNLLDETGQRMWVIQKERPDSPRKMDGAMAAVLSWDARIRALTDGATAKEPEWTFGAR